MKDGFTNHAKEIQERARQYMDQGSVTAGYKADRPTILILLNEALATEIVCVLRYRRHYFMARGLVSKPVAEEFLEYANEELAHADLLAARICQLRGKPDFSPLGLASRSHTAYIEGTTLVEMIREDLVAERIAIETYRELIDFVGSKDPTTRRLLEKILAQEEEHADELASLICQSEQTANNTLIYSREQSVDFRPKSYS